MRGNKMRGEPNGLQRKEKEEIGFFQEDNGNKSSMRLFCFIALVFSLVITIYGLFKQQEVFIYVITYLVAAFAPKAIQKFAEQKVK
jgi:hypothetical protein